MASDAYEILALFMRYVFVLLAAFFTLGLARVLLGDHMRYQKEMRRLPDAGSVGKLVDLDSGQAYPIAREGLIGASRQADVRLSGQGLTDKEARFIFEDGRGLRIIPEKGREILLDGVPVEGSACALHGSEIAVGNTLLSVRLLSGLSVPQGRRAAEPESLPGGQWIEVMPLPEDRIEGYADESAAGREERPFDDAGRGD